MKREFDILIEKLKGFKKKYYQNLILKGLIISFAIILAMFLLVNTYEYFAWNNTLVRQLIFYIFTGSTLLVLFFYVLIPVARLVSIGKPLTDDEAAEIIGKHFPDVSDKLLNTLQLQHLRAKTGHNEDARLLIASIDQKAASLSPVPFKSAINLKKNVRYVKYILPPVLIILLSLIVFPAFITEPSARIIKFNVDYVKPLPYTLRLLNEELEVLQKNDFTVRVEAMGEAIPADIRIDDGNYKYRMTDSGNGIFQYTFKDVSTDVHFSIETKEFSSQNYHLRVIPKPIIYNFDVRLTYPAYLKKKDDLIENSGDLVVPEGAEINWHIYAKDANSVLFKNDGDHKVLTTEGNNIFQHTIKATGSFWYSLFAENEYVKYADSLSYAVQVIKDEYPIIQVDQEQEETNYSFVFFSGTLSDDHGYHSLLFLYRVDTANDTQWQYDAINIDPDLPKQTFSYVLKAGEFRLKPGDNLSYYFEVRDNDAVNGYKRAKTTVQQYHLPGFKEIDEKLEKTSGKIKEKIKETLAELDNINKQIEEKRLELFNKKELSWQDKKQLTELLDKQKNVESQLNELKKLNEELNQFEDMLTSEKGEQLEEKIDKLNQMIDQLMAEDVEQMMKEIEKLDKDKLSELLENIENKNNSLKTDLEQNLELYKQLELEKKVQETVDKLEKLAEEQNKLADETKENELSDDQAQKEQGEINDKFSDIEKEIKESEKLNSELEEPLDFDPDQKAMDEITQELNEASEKLGKGKQKKASENQKNAGSKMEKMASDLAMMMQSAMMARMGEDAEKIKNMLDNLLDLSFGQEKLIETIGLTNQNDPKYVDNLAELQLLKDGYLALHDSLIALAKRQAAVQQFIVKESEKINLHINRALLYLQDRRTGQALNDQQYSMTAMNNLALMLSESLDQMKSSMQMSGQNQGKSCPNPGEGKPGSMMEDIIKMQQGLNQGMQDGKKQNGLDGEQGLNKQSEQLARMAAIQSEIRKQLQSYLDELESQQGANGELSKMIDEMKKAEEDIVNRKITQETLERQKQIEVRLLKSEKAKLEREKKEARESTEGINRKKEITGVEVKPKDEKKNNEDFLHTIPIEMTPYFNDLLKRYLYKIETTDGS